MSFFRYPGGKAKLSSPIVAKIEQLTEGKEINAYVEPFFGGGAICFKLLEKNTFPNLTSIAINDKDFTLFCLWRTVFYEPLRLAQAIEAYTPTVEDFYKFKEILLRNNFKQMTYADIALMKLAIHQMSYSGLGTKAGGPIGGKKQTSKYDVACRWSPSSMVKKILKYNALLTKYDMQFYTHDFIEAMGIAYSVFLSNEVNNKPKINNVFIYLDPPYYIKGDELYSTSFTEDDHIKLAAYLKKSSELSQGKTSWLLSYDDCPEVRELYSWAQIDDVSVNYTIRTARQKNELLIYPHPEKSIA